MTLIVGAIIVDGLAASRRLLAARRTAPTWAAGRWEFVGGKVEPNEAPEAALQREVMEELGVEVELGDELLGPRGGTWPITSALRMRLWFCAITSGIPQLTSAHDDLRWLTPGQWHTVHWLDADDAVIDELRRLPRFTETH